MKAKNIELAKENALLKKENEELKQKVQYYADLYEKNNDEPEKETTEEKENEGALKEAKEEKNDGINIEEELNKKTVAQLKQILNEDFGAFKEDWKSLTKKEDIIKYIVSKIS